MLHELNWKAMQGCRILTFFYWTWLQQRGRKDDEEAEERGMKSREEQEEGWSRMGQVWQPVQIQRRKEQAKSKTLKKEWKHKKEEEKEQRKWPKKYFEVQ